MKHKVPACAHGEAPRLKMFCTYCGHKLDYYSHPTIGIKIFKKFYGLRESGYLHFINKRLSQTKCKCGCLNPRPIKSDKIPFFISPAILYGASAMFIALGTLAISEAWTEMGLCLIPPYAREKLIIGCLMFILGVLGIRLQWGLGK